MVPWVNPPRQYAENRLRRVVMQKLRGILTVENNEGAIYLTCHLGKQRLALIPTLPWRSDLIDKALMRSARRVIRT